LSSRQGGDVSKGSLADLMNLQHIVAAESAGSTGPSGGFQNYVDQLRKEKQGPFLRHVYYGVRHGESRANVAGKIVSHPLIATQQYGLSSPTGQEQAMQVASQVVDAYYQLLDAEDAAYSHDHSHHHDENCNHDHESRLEGIVLLSSDYQRAFETAEYIRLAVLTEGIPIYPTNDITTEKRLRERYFGNYEGNSSSNYSLVWEQDAKDASHSENGVESVLSVRHRATAMIHDWETVYQSAEGGQHVEKAPSLHNNLNSRYMIVLVSHGDVLQILQTAMENKLPSHHRSAIPHWETATLRALLPA
jgi:glucosyl-3-phosphoglycerate phosphatase